MLPTINLQSNENVPRSKYVVELIVCVQLSLMSRFKSLMKTYNGKHISIKKFSGKKQDYFAVFFALYNILNRGLWNIMIYKE